MGDHGVALKSPATMHGRSAAATKSAIARSCASRSLDQSARIGDRGWVAMKVKSPPGWRTSATMG